MMLRSFICLAALTLAACAPEPSLNYSSSSLHTGQGRISVGEVTYVAADSGKVKPNQIRNSAIGSVIIKENIAEYVKTALQLELKQAGYTAVNATTAIEARIIDFFVGDMGYDADWRLEVAYDFKNKSTGETVRSITIVSEHVNSKFIDFGMNVNKAIRLNFDKLFESAEFKASLGQ